MNVRPQVSAVAEDLYELVAPLVDDDADHGWAALLLCEFLTRPVQELWDVLASRGAIEEWDAVWSVDAAPEFALPWLAQFHGVALPPGLTGAVARDYIRNSGGLNKGTVEAIRAAVRPTLTGSRRVTVNQRYETSTGVLVVTYTGETPDAVASEAAARAAMPAGFTGMVFEVHDGQSYGEARGKQPTYGQWETTWPTYGDLKRG